MTYNIVVRITSEEVRESMNEGKEFKVFTDIPIEDVERHLMIVDRNKYIEFVRMIPSH